MYILVYVDRQVSVMKIGGWYYKIYSCLLYALHAYIMLSPFKFIIIEM